MQKKVLLVSLKTKKEIFNRLHELVELKISTALSMIDSAKESKNNETKSTAGDKYETGRAMMQTEQDKSELRLLQAKRLQAVLSTIDPSKTHHPIALGSLVITDKEKYFISIGIGKVHYNDDVYFAISPEAPIGKLMIGKQVNESITYNGVTRTILAII